MTRNWIISSVFFSSSFRERGIIYNRPIIAADVLAYWCGRGCRSRDEAQAFCGAEPFSCCTIETYRGDRSCLVISKCKYWHVILRWGTSIDTAFILVTRHRGVSTLARTSSMTSSIVSPSSIVRMASGSLPHCKLRSVSGVAKTSLWG